MTLEEHFLVTGSAERNNLDPARAIVAWLMKKSISVEMTLQNSNFFQGFLVESWQKPTLLQNTVAKTNSEWILIIWYGCLGHWSRVEPHNRISVPEREESTWKSPVTNGTPQSLRRANAKVLKNSASKKTRSCHTSLTHKPHAGSLELLGRNCVSFMNVLFSNEETDSTLQENQKNKVLPA